MVKFKYEIHHFMETKNRMLYNTYHECDSINDAIEKHLKKGFVKSDIKRIFRLSKEEVLDFNDEHNYIENLKSHTEVEMVTVYCNGVSEIHYKDGQDMLVNNVIYSDAYLTGWEEEDCFIKR